jgi:hypothetical protein
VSFKCGDIQRSTAVLERGADRDTDAFKFTHVTAFGSIGVYDLPRARLKTPSAFTS